MKAFALILYSILLFGLTSVTEIPAIPEEPVNEAPAEVVLSSEPLMGEVIMFAGNFAPRGWAFCDGQLLPISQYSALFSLLGTMYGGDGRTTFALPDLQGDSEVNYIIAIQGIYPSRS